MTESEAKAIFEDGLRIKEQIPNLAQAYEVAIKALETNEKITEIVNRQLIAGKNNYKEIYNSFHEIAKIVQDNYRWSEV